MQRPLAQMSVAGEALEWPLGRCEAHTDLFSILWLHTRRHGKAQKMVSEKDWRSAVHSVPKVSQADPDPVPKMWTGATIRNMKDKRKHWRKGNLYLHAGVTQSKT